MKKALGLVLALTLVVFATTVYAAPSDRGPENAPGRGIRGERMHHRFGTHLDLTKEQKDKVHDVWNRYAKDTRDLKYDLAERRIEMRKLFTDPKTDQASLVAKQKEMAGLQQKLMERRAQATLEWRSVLTPEQLQKLDRMPRGRGMGRGFGVM